MVLGASASPSGGAAHQSSTSGGVFSVQRNSTSGGVF